MSGISQENRVGHGEHAQGQSNRQSVTTYDRDTSLYCRVCADYIYEQPLITVIIFYITQICIIMSSPSNQRRKNNYVEYIHCCDECSKGNMVYDQMCTY